MNRQGFTCDQASCRKPAVAFTFSGSKVKACKAHASLLSDPVFPITAYTFIERLEDGTLYQERSALATRGLGHLLTLETQCESDWKTLQKRLNLAKDSALATVERCFQEVQIQSWQRYQELKHLFTTARSDLERLVSDKSFHLSPECKSLCKDKPPAVLFQLVLGDFSAAVAEILMTNCCLLPVRSTIKQEDSLEQVTSFLNNQAEKGHFDIAEEARQFALSLDFTRQSSSYRETAKKQQAKAARQVLQLLSNTATEEEVRDVVRKYMQAGIEAKERGDYEKAKKKLQKGQELLNQWNLESPELCLQLGIVFSRFAQWSEAEEVLKHGLDVEITAQPASDLALSVSNSLAEMYYQRGRWVEALAAGEKTLQIGNSSQNAYELYKALFYLASSQYMLGNRKAALEQVRDWTGRLVADTPKSKCVMVYVLADKLHKKTRREEKAMVFEQSLELAQEALPDCYLTACVRHRLGLIYKSQQKADLAEDQFLTACQIFATHYPNSLEFGNCLHSLGTLYRATKQLEKAAKEWQRACQLYATHYPLTLDYTISLHSLGLLYKTFKQAEQAEEHYLKACQIYDTHFPLSLDYANCLNNLGFLYCDLMKLSEQAEKEWLKACAIYQSKYPQSLDYAICLKNLAFLYECKGRRAEAAQRVEQALKVYQESGNQAKVAECEQTIKRLRG